CLDGVGVVPGCGNRIIDPGELCDDGNHASGDGCNAGCTSNEVCGNGFVDPGEACDDGNLRSRDGCDSTCGVEQETWTLDGLEPWGSWPTDMVYDETRHQALHVGSGTWAWDGTKWTLLSPDSPTIDGW